MLQEITYFTSILLCISLGRCYRQIEEPAMKRNYGTGLGILTAFLVCGRQVYHTAIMVWGNVVIILCCDRRYVHKISLMFTWAYLIFLHIHLQNSHYIVWFHQAMALRLVGLAFETHSVKKSNVLRISRTSATEDEGLRDVPGAAEIIAYAYYFIGIHRGPYYSMKVFQEHFESPFVVLDDCRRITEQKLKKAFLCSLGFMLLRMKYSPKIYEDREFYVSYAADFRYLYNIPLLLMFFLQSQILMLLCTSVATESAFGVYPAKSLPLPGVGPSTKLSVVNMNSKSQTAFEQDYNFTMLKCFDNHKVLLGPRMRDTMRGWDMPTRHWFWNNIYKSTNIRADKEVRGGLSFLAWALWCGPTLQQIVLSSTLYVHICLEKEYSTLCNTGGSMKMAWVVGFSIMRVFCLIYLTPCLTIEDSATLLKYYYSILWAYHILLILLIIAAVAISKANERPQ